MNCGSLALVLALLDYMMNSVLLFFLFLFLFLFIIYGLAVDSINFAV